MTLDDFPQRTDIHVSDACPTDVCRLDEWPQYLVAFAEATRAEETVATYLLPVLDASADGDPPRWSFLRKHPHWRLRHPPPSNRRTRRDQRTELAVVLDQLTAKGLVTGWTPSLHEPEATAFGGPDGMNVAHDLFHHDSRAVLLRNGCRPAATSTQQLGRRELALLLPSVMMRAAGLDWYEQGDTWARVAAHRLPEPVTRTEPTDRARTAARRLMTVDAGPTSRLVTGGALADLGSWVAAFHDAGRHLAALNRDGHLHRGLRAVIAHHVLFHWNRLGLAAALQHALSTLAMEIVMGTSEPTRHIRETAPEPADRDRSVAPVNTHVIDAAQTGTPDEAERLRHALVDTLTGADLVRTARVEEALRTVPRHRFVPHATLEDAYANSTVTTKTDAAGTPISCASQPGVVALMLDQLDARPGHNVLELGAGTGYNAALLAHLVGPAGHVTTIDVDDDIVDAARTHLTDAGVPNVTVLLGDGALGHPDAAPYERIIATVGAHGIPHAWLDQLAPDGRMLVPLRLRGAVSRSIAFERRDGAWVGVDSAMNTFMPLRRGIADDPRTRISLTGDGSVALVTNGDQNTDTVALAIALGDVLHQDRTEVWTGVDFRGSESAEWLELWLTCVLPSGLSRMPTTPQALETGLVTTPYPSATAAFDKGALAYLTRRKADRTAPDGAALYEFGVIGHGPGGDVLAERMADEVRTWDRDYRSRDVRFELQTLDAPATPDAPGRFTLTTALNRIVVDWR
ncbi:methyltransferase, FxLD system [Yinghuangia sp. ASG 101]|uniref:methyltransferase, FxLD system n=1 Tax=Yinghuangia sp. ASG 101 TaxID=2896848 RepID=UPI001E4D2C8D|nr:methyltransferase, FxLD system [Yinghuangia sp. ASG 101]UGQ13570.1 methyltransferase, FxLD system [Yinghuangia sp. ASG 101]